MIPWFGWYINPKRTFLRPVAKTKEEDNKFFVKFYVRNRRNQIVHGDWIEVEKENFYPVPIVLFESLVELMRHKLRPCIAWHVDSSRLMLRVVEEKKYRYHSKFGRNVTQVRYSVNGNSSSFFPVESKNLYHISDVGAAVCIIYRMLKGLN